MESLVKILIRFCVTQKAFFVTNYWRLQTFTVNGYNEQRTDHFASREHDSTIIHGDETGNSSAWGACHCQNTSCFASFLFSDSIKRNCSLMMKYTIELKVLSKVIENPEKYFDDWIMEIWIDVNKIFSQKRQKVLNHSRSCLLLGFGKWTMYENNKNLFFNTNS